jgi:prevent-host-death family protein
MATWQLREAKARFSELLRQARQGEPQRITVHGRPAAVVLSQEDYERLTAPKPSFVDFMRASPLVGVELQIERDSSLPRDVDL